MQVADVAQVKADGRFDVVSGSTDYGYVIMQMCPSKPPFDNPEVRKAMQLAFDRDAIIKLAYQGQALPAYGLWPTNNVNFNPATKKINTYNPKKAKQILAKAGVKDVTFEMHYVTATNYGPLTEILQSQLKAIGITATIVPDADILNSFIAPQKPGAQVIPGSRRNVDKYNRLFAPGTISVAVRRRPARHHGHGHSHRGHVVGRPGPSGGIQEGGADGGRERQPHPARLHRQQLRPRQQEGGGRRCLLAGDRKPPPRQRVREEEDLSNAHGGGRVEARTDVAPAGARSDDDCSVASSCDGADRIRLKETSCD